MEKRQVGTKPTGPCEKVYRTVAENCPLRSIHRFPLRSKIAMSENGKASPNNPAGRTPYSPSKTHFFLRKLVSPYKTHPGQVNIPIESPPSVMMNEMEKIANPMISTTTIQAGDHSTIKGNRTGTPSQNQATKPATVASGNAEIQKLVEKPKKKTESKIPQSNMIVIESPGQGINAFAITKVESAAKPQMPEKGLKPKTQSATSVAKPINDPQVKEDKKPGKVDGHDHVHKYSAYIEHVKSQLRTKSDVSEATTKVKPPTRAPAKRDSFNDKISSFIARAQKNMKITHLGD